MSLSGNRRDLLYFAVMAGLFVAVGQLQSWNVALSILNLCLISAVMALGVAGWIFEMGRLYMVLMALGLDASPALIPVVALGHAVLSTVPTPGGVGAVEPGVTGLLLIELSQPEAAAATIVDRSITYLSIIVVGGALFLLRQALRARGSVSREKAATESGPR